MKLTNSLRTWWQQQTGEDDTPLDGDTPAWVVSMVFHLLVLIAVAMIPLVASKNFVELTLTNTPPEEIEEIEIVLPDDFYHSELVQEEIGANSVNGEQMAMAEAPVLSEISVEPTVTEINSDTGEIEVNEMVELATGPNYNANLTVKGAPVGVGSEGAAGAIDRITHEILLSLEERKTLVVWLFDQSGSLTRQRQAIHDRFDRIYEELGVIEAAGNERFAKYDDKPLLTSMIAFGEKVTLLTQKPTDNLAEIKEALSGVQQDDSGVERVFQSIYMAAETYKSFRLPDPETKQPERNVMLIAVTDEAGDDQAQGLEDTIRICRRYAMPVYVVGVPAPFGRDETMVKWVDPDPQYDQTPQWGRVSQGPESFLPERVKLHFAASEKDKYETPIDSGFGPFALTRLSYETGGIYFAVHPNRNVTRSVGRGETAAFSAHMEHFFDPQIMRRYRPDYVSADEYMRRVSSNKARGALVQTAKMSFLAPMGDPKTRFVKSSEAEFSNDLTEAQKEAAKLEPKINALFETIKLGEADRKNEDVLRWQAGYDLAYGRILAVKVRTEGYNAMLAAAKRGLKLEDPKNNTWTLVAANELDAGSQLEKQAEKARTVLESVVKDHPGTPWALLAQKELDNPVGWKWQESFTDLTPQNEGMGGNGNNNNNNNNPVMLNKPPPKRPLPKL